MKKITQYAIRIGRPKIKRILCDMAEDGTIWVDGFQRDKHGEFIQFFDTWEEARDYLCDEQIRKVNILKHDISKATSTLEQIQQLKKQEEE